MCGRNHMSIQTKFLRLRQRRPSSNSQGVTAVETAYDRRLREAVTARPRPQAADPVTFRLRVL